MEIISSHSLSAFSLGSIPSMYEYMLQWFEGVPLVLETSSSGQQRGEASPVGRCQDLVRGALMNEFLSCLSELTGLGHHSLVLSVEAGPQACLLFHGPPAFPLPAKAGVAQGLTRCSHLVSNFLASRITSLRNPVFLLDYPSSCLLL